MALLHSSLGDRTTYTPQGIANADGTKVQVFEDEQCTVPANLAAYNPANPGAPGAPTPGAELTVDAWSNRPKFWDLNDRDYLWVVAGNGPAERIQPDAQPQVTALAARVGTVEGVAAAAETPAGAQSKADAAQAAAVAASAQRAANLADLANAATARTNLGLAGAATRNVGTTAGTVAAGDDSRIVGAVRKSGETSPVDLSGSSSVRLPSVEQMVIPPAALASPATGLTAWYAANRATLMRFTLHRRGKFSGVTLPVGAASGNIEVAVLSCTRTGTNAFDLMKIASTGVIPCPTPGQAPMGTNSAHVTFTSPVTLDPGEYALGLWCDNTTATFAHVLSNPVQWAGWSVNDQTSSASGVPTTYTNVVVGARAFAATLEGSVPVRSTAVGLGDSITALQTWFLTANAFTGMKYNFTSAGVGGQTTAQMLARVSTDVVSLNPALSTVLGGTNDVGQSIAAATIISNLGAIVSAITAGGARVILGTVPPRLNAEFAALTAGQVAIYGTVNAWIRGQASASVQIVDWSVQLSTGDGITPNLAYFSDHVHPNAAGQAVMSDVLRPLL